MNELCNQPLIPDTLNLMVLSLPIIFGIRRFILWNLEMLTNLRTTSYLEKKNESRT